MGACRPRPLRPPRRWPCSSPSEEMVIFKEGGALRVRKAARCKKQLSPGLARHGQPASRLDDP